MAHTLEVLATLEGLLSKAHEAETNQRGYIITGDEGLLRPYQAAFSEAEPAPPATGPAGGGPPGAGRPGRTARAADRGAVRPDAAHHRGPSGPGPRSRPRHDRRRAGPGQMDRDPRPSTG